eukprot:TRINITY_DN2365_c0_g2_i2.p1 TRINITY_DN2365_c0_g2~~TRINITY_DN2365_c0_g2_i2.p1  ORF type:complete len:388 (+),score=79.50 TRINITY_DN2365_c0_g2_i2:739-1902(+)
MNVKSPAFIAFFQVQSFHLNLFQYFWQLYKKHIGLIFFILFFLYALFQTYQKSLLQNFHLVYKPQNFNQNMIKESEDIDYDFISKYIKDDPSLNNPDLKKDDEPSLFGSIQIRKSGATEVFGSIGQGESHSYGNSGSGGNFGNSGNNNFKKKYYNNNNEDDADNEIDISVEEESGEENKSISKPVMEAKKEFLDHLNDESLSVDTCSRVNYDWKKNQRISLFNESKKYFKFIIFKQIVLIQYINMVIMKTKSKQSIIELKDIWKVYQIGDIKVEALRGVSVSIKQGEFVAITGPSGSGKSTMMNMVGALDIPSKGAIYLDGKDISKLHESDLAEIRGKKIGFVFQQFNLISTLSALENVMLPMEFQEAEDIEEKANKHLLLLVQMTE